MPQLSVTLRISIDQVHEQIARANSLGLDLDEPIPDLETAVVAVFGSLDLPGIMIEQLDVERLDGQDAPEIDSQDWARAAQLLALGATWREIRRRCPGAVPQVKIR